MALTKDQNTDLARRLGLLSGSEEAGSGLVQQRLAEAAKTNPGLVKQYEQGVSQIQGTPFTQPAPQVSAPAQPTYQPKTGVSALELSSALTEGFSGKNATTMANLGKNNVSSQILSVDIPQLKAQVDRGVVGVSDVAQKKLDELYNKYVGGGQQTTQQPTQQAAPAPTPAAPKPVMPQAAPASSSQSYQDYYNQDTAELNKLLAPNKVTRPDEMALPDILQELSNYTGQQKRANIATKGIFGNGVDDTSSRYFLNSLLREYLNQDNAPTNYDLLPVEEQYLQRLGVPITSSTGSEDFLRQLGLYYKNQGGL